MEGPTLFRTWTSLDYESVSEKSTQLAARLKEEGIEGGDRILLESPSSVEVYIVILAALKIGAVIIPVHFNLDSHAFTDRTMVAQPEWIITDRIISSYPDVNGTISLSGLFADRRSGGEYNRTHRSAELPSFGCFTSGTTGRPKLVLHSQKTHGLAHLSSLAWNDLKPGDRHLNISSPGWAKFFWSSLLVPLTAGATVVIKPDGLEPDKIAHFCNKHSVTSLCAPVPFLIKALSGNSGEKPVSLSDITTVGEPVPDHLVTSCCKKWGIRIRTGYGQSEATAVMGELKSRPDALSILPGYSVRVKQYPGEAAGRLEYKSFAEGSFYGYVNEKGLERPTISLDGWQWSGDYADGTPGKEEFKILGRGNDVFRINGHILSPSEVEHILCHHPYIQAAAISSFLDSQGILHAQAHVVLIGGVGSSVTTDGLQEWINRQLPDDVNIDRMTVVDSLPMSINGKIQRGLLSVGYHT